MSYATLQDLIERAGETEILQVADRDDDGIADPSVVAAAIDTAGQAIDGYLGTRFALPLSQTPPLVKGWAVSIARYTLHRDGPPDHVKADYRDALQSLRDVSAGKISLPMLDGRQPESGSAGTVVTTGSEPVFTNDSFEGWL